MSSKISLIEYYLPTKLITNESISENMLGWTSDKILNKIGIERRYISEKNETALDLAEKACNKLSKKIDFSKVDALVLCTQSPDYFLPTSACILQDRLGLNKNTLCFDYNLGCSGYIYGLAIIGGLINSGTINNAFLVTAETYSKFIGEKDGANQAIFGDGASVTYIEKSNENCIGKFVLGTDGSGYKNLIVLDYGIRNLNYTNTPKLFMNGPEIFDFTNKIIPKLITETLIKNNVPIDEIDFFVFHQANTFILNHLRDKLNIPKSKFIIDMKFSGNTVSSTIPIVLSNKLQKNPLFFKNKKVLLVGFGVGYSWGATVINF
jgi:3-oxoacyl-[acyl-carrier-protein] synthase-3